MFMNSEWLQSFWTYSSKIMMSYPLPCKVVVCKLLLTLKAVWWCTPSSSRREIFLSQIYLAGLVLAQLDPNLAGCSHVFPKFIKSFFVKIQYMLPWSISVIWAALCRCNWLFGSAEFTISIWEKNSKSLQVQQQTICFSSWLTFVIYT